MSGDIKETRGTPKPRRQPSNPPVKTSPPKKGAWMKGISSAQKGFRTKKHRGGGK